MSRRRASWEAALLSGLLFLTLALMVWR